MEFFPLCKVLILFNFYLAEKVPSVDSVVYIQGFSGILNGEQCAFVFAGLNGLFVYCGTAEKQNFGRSFCIIGKSDCNRTVKSSGIPGNFNGTFQLQRETFQTLDEFRFRHIPLLQIKHGFCNGKVCCGKRIAEDIHHFKAVDVCVNAFSVPVIPKAGNQLFVFAENIADRIMRKPDFLNRLCRFEKAGERIADDKYV